MDSDATRKKTLKIKRPGAGGGEEGEGGEGDAKPAAPAAGPVAAVPVMATGGKPASYMVSGICGILAFLILVALLVVQYLEWNFYHSPPSAFVMDQGGM